jgi:hypothetical protein
MKKSPGLRTRGRVVSGPDVVLPVTCLGHRDTCVAINALPSLVGSCELGQPLGPHLMCNYADPMLMPPAAWPRSVCGQHGAG